jgi:virulence factor Mce-like protein
VGKVETVEPTGTDVTVKFYYEGEQKVPADAKAAVISPSIVGDRFIQLTPAYSGGAQLKNNATLGEDRTATPLELDEIFGSINDLTKALGPDGANKPVENGVGPLTRLLDSTARNFGGQGAQFNTTLKNLGALTKTLADNKEELFGTLAQVEEFTKTLADNDDTVRRFNDSLAGGADLLAGERQELAAVLRNLSVAMVQVRGFVKENRGSLTRNIAGLNRISKVLVKRRDQVDKTLRYAPAALNNLYLAGNQKQGTLDTRNNAGQLESALLEDPRAALCTLIGATAPDCEEFAGLGSSPRAAAFAGDTDAKPLVREPIDRSLGGLVEVTR